MRELLNLDIKKLKKTDKMFLIQKNSSEILHYDQMLMNNKFMSLTIFALFVSLVSLVVSSEYIGVITKPIFVLFMISLPLILVFQFKNAKQNISLDYNRIKNESAILFKDILSYSYNKEVKNE